MKQITDLAAGTAAEHLVAADLSGRRFIGIEREAAYADISRSRLEAAEAEFCGVADLI